MTIQESFKSLLETLGFSEAARNALVDADGEALVPADLVNFTESNTVELFKSLRKSDVKIPHKAENSFQTFRFLCHKWRTTGHPLDETVCTYATTATLLRWKLIKTELESYEDPTNEIKLEKASEIRDFIREFPNKLDNLSNPEGVPLSYIIRSSDDVPGPNDPKILGGRMANLPIKGYC